MTTTSTFHTIKIQDMEIGHRYVELRPGFDTYVVTAVEIHDAKFQVLRNGQWVTPKLVTVTYNHDESITHEFDTDLAYDFHEVVRHAADAR